MDIFRKAGFAFWPLVVILAAISLPPVVPAQEPAPAKSVENSVVKVFSTVRYPDYYRPWTKQAPTEISGTGVVIDGRRILSNAHMVQYASQIQVQANQAGDKISATVEAIAPGIDLAVLKLDDESFFTTHPPLARASTLPQIKDVVMAYGYPQGGSSLSITKGIVSRIEYAPYNYGVFGLRIQIDAAINPGNSGGPAMVDDKMIGLAFSRLGGAQSIGYIIPCEEIELFLQDIADGHYDGKPVFGDELQTLENPALRAFLKLDKSLRGVVVHVPASHDPDYPLKEWDLITKIGGTPVDDQGLIQLDSGLRVGFTYLIQKIIKDGKVPLTVIREGRESQIDLPMSMNRQFLAQDLNGAYPPYFICGPMVFSTVSQQFIGTMLSQYSSYLMGAYAARGSLLMKRYGEKPAFPGEELVMVSAPFFPHALTKGYLNPVTRVVKSINGTPIRNLRHLVEVIRDSRDEFLAIAFDQVGAETVIFPRKEMIAATDDILTDNGVRSQGSPDMLAVWNAKPAK